jgi:hypothetical protein
MRTLYLAISAILLGVLAACSGAPKKPDQATRDASATARLQAIPSADPQRYRSMTDMKNWRNPYLVALPEGVGLLDANNNELRLLKTTEVLETLAALPASAWPYGRVVVLTENPITSTEQQRVAIRRNKNIVAGTLEGAHVLIHWVPSG